MTDRPSQAHRALRIAGAAIALAALITISPARVAAAEGDDELRVLEASDGPTLHAYLLAEVARQYEARRAELACDLESPEALAKRRARLRSQLLEMLGELPERTPLIPREVGYTIQCDGYRIEKVTYESRPFHTVTANLYLPDGATGRVPGVLVPCGHSDNGKASAAYQSVCILLAKNGCAALIYDPIGQGERHQLPGAVRHGTTEHTLIGAGALLVGWNAANYRVWDGLRSMDYLASRPEVDPQRLGCTGNSGGGTMTTWLMAVDDRIAAAAPSCFITTVEKVFSTIGPQDCEQHFPAQGALGIEHADFITMRAPKPTLILAAERDFFDIGGTRTAYADAEAVYRVLGHPERVGLFTYDDEHGFSQPRREAAVGWMRRWLADDQRPVKEPPLKLQTDADLQVTLHGQVLRDFSDERSVVDLANQRARALAEYRETTWDPKDTRKCRETIRRVLRLPDAPTEPPTTRSRGTIARQGYSIEKLVVERPGQVPLPALLFVPDGASPEGEKRPGVLYVDGRGKSADAGLDGPVARLVGERHVVLSVDLRGYGETADDKKQSKYHNDEFRTSMLGYHIGRSLVCQRVEDVLSALDVLAARPEVDANAIHLVGIGLAGPVALHAAALEPRFQSVELRDSISSWTHDVVARPLDANLLGHVVPGALLEYDLTDLAAMLGDRLKVHAKR